MMTTSTLCLDEFDYDEEVDEELDIKKIKLAKKKEIAKAKSYFNENEGAIQATT